MNNFSIKRIRVAAKLSQSAAALQVGVAMRTLQDWEAGTAKTSASALELLALKTDQHPIYLLVRRDKGLS